MAAKKILLAFVIANYFSNNEGQKNFIGGGEESFGFMPAGFVRDKDAVSSCALMAEIAAYAKDQGKSLYEMVQDIYLEYGYSREKMKYIYTYTKPSALLLSSFLPCWVFSVVSTFS